LPSLLPSLGEILGNIIPENLSESFEGPEVPRKHRSDGLLQLGSNLFESQTSDVPQVQDLLVSFAEPPHGLPQGLDRLRVESLVPGAILAAGLRDGTKHLAGDRYRLPLSSPHFVPKPIHGDSEQPRLESALFDVGADLGRHGAETRLGNLLSQIVIATIRDQKGVNPGGEGIHQLAPGGVIASSGSLDQQLGVLRIQTSLLSTGSIRPEIRSHAIGASPYNRPLRCSHS
jgi:hypothetical protein